MGHRLPPPGSEQFYKSKESVACYYFNVNLLYFGRKFDINYSI